MVLVRLGELAAARGEDPELSDADVDADVVASESSGPLPVAPNGGFDAPDSDRAAVPEVAVPESALPEIAAPELEFDVPEVVASDALNAQVDGDWRDVKIGEYEIELPPAEPEIEAPAPIAEDTFDLAAELSEAMDEDALGASYERMGESADGFAAVFKEFKKGVSASLTEGDYEAHYDLGIAYREMDLLEDAIGEFRTSMGAPARYVDSLHMMGVCSLDMDRASDAITHFGTALSASAINDEQRLAVRFELGRAFRSAGDIANARDAFEAVAAVDPLFCDVEQELVELEKLKSEVEADASELQAEIVDDDDYESFDDLLSEVSDGEAENAGKMENFDDLFSDVDGDPSDSGSAASDRKRKKISFV